MKKLFTSVTIAVVFALTLSIAPVAATPPADVTIVSDMHPVTGPIDPFDGTFVASGPAVDAGIICPSGGVDDISNPAVGWQSHEMRIIILSVHKHFTCDDGSGSFEMNMRVRIAPTGITAQWIIVGGDGPYSRLFGAGNLYAEWISENLLRDHYSGGLHIE